VASALAVAVAAWLAPASIDVVGWSAAGADRIAVFAPLYKLWIALAAASAVAVFLGIRRVPARLVSPALALWLWTVPYLPWLGARFPVLLLLAGPLKWFIAGAAGVAIASRLGLRAPEIVQSRKTRGVVFLLSFALYVTCGLRSFDRIGISGDEPHYLVVTHSVLVDRDLQIENNYVGGDYHAFYDGTLRPDYLRRGVNEQIYSIHAPGLSALVLPGYAVGGARGAIVTVAFLAALASVAIFDVAFLVGGASAARFTWAVVCLSVPVIPHAWSLYPEAAAFAIVAWAVRWAVEREPMEREAVAERSRWFARGVCIALLPWLHTKFVVLLAALTLWLLIELRGRIAASVAFLVPIAASLIAWLSFFHVIYGRFDPQAPYGSSARDVVRLANLPRGLLGMLIDQKFGLLTYAPVYIVAAGGAWIAIRQRQWRPPAIAALATLALFVGSSARFYMWWGGASAPARFLVPILPLAAPGVALAFATARGWTRAAVNLLGAFSVAIGLVAIGGSDPHLLFSDAHGTSRLVRTFEGSVPLDSMLPTFTEEKFPARAIAPTDAERRSALRGRLAVLTAFDPARRRAFDYVTQSKLSPQDWIDRGRVDADISELSDPVSLPSGVYQVQTWRAGASGPRAATLELPLAMRKPLPDLIEAGDTGRVTRIELEARSIVPAGDRPNVQVETVEPIAGYPHAAIAYTDAQAYPEGGVFWTRGRSRSTIVVVPAGAREMIFTLHVGPGGADVTLDAAGQRHQQTMKADETRALTIPIPPGTRYAPVTVGASRAFRPSEHDPRSTDTRSLGCQVRVELR
jgi:hypothetical protein